MPLRFPSAGESHGSALMGILEGLPAGLHLAPAFIMTTGEPLRLSAAIMREILPRLRSLRK